MAKGINKRQPNLFEEVEREDLTYFERGWDIKRPMESYSIDNLTPWFQMKIEQLSPAERATLIEVLRVNASKPVATPFTLEDIIPPQNGILYEARLRGTFRKSGERASRTRPISQSLSSLLEIGVLRLATPSEKELVSNRDNRLNLYVLTCPLVEEWWRMRNHRPDSRIKDIRSLEKS